MLIELTKRPANGNTASPERPVPVALIARHRDARVAISEADAIRVTLSLSTGISGTGTLPLQQSATLRSQSLRSMGEDRPRRERTIDLNPQDDDVGHRATSARPDWWILGDRICAHLRG